MNPRVSICLALYRRLASAYPHEFRILYGEDLERLGEDAVPEAWRRYGVPGLVRLLADIAVRLPAEYLAEIRQDAIYALRMLAKSPGFTSVAVLSVAVGIGMCCAVRSEIQSILGPPPGVRDPAALVTFHWSQASYPYFERYRDRHQAVAAATAFVGPVPFAVAFTGDKSAKAERFYGHLVSPEYFSTLGVTPAAAEWFDGHHRRHRSQGLSGYLARKPGRPVRAGDVRHRSGSRTERRSARSHRPRDLPRGVPAGAGRDHAHGGSRSQRRDPQFRPGARNPARS
jgi:hypothetical protein